MSVLGLSAAALALAQAAPAATTEDGHYQCEVSGDEGRTALTSRYFADGTEALTYGTWSGTEGTGRARLSIHWHFMLGDERPYRAHVTIAVALQRKASGSRLLMLTRDDSAALGGMKLGAAAVLEKGGRQASAFVDLQTLLDYAGEKEDLAWELVRPETYQGTIENGWLGLPRLKEAVKRFGPLLDELTAKRADFRNLCSWSAGRPEED